MPPTVDPDRPVNAIMKDYPETIRVFLRRRMLCIGCPVAVVHTIEDAALAHGIHRDDLTAEIEAAMAVRTRSRARPRRAAAGGGR